MAKASNPHCFNSQVLVDGVWGGGLNLFDRGLAFGDGLFETLLWVDGRIPLLEYHVSRLASSCLALSIPFNEALIRSYLQTFSQYLSNNSSLLHSAEVKTPKALIKLILTRGVGGQGYVPPSVQLTAPASILLGRAFNKMPLNNCGGVTLSVCQTTLGVNTLLAGHKHLSRLEYVLAGQELKQAAPSGEGVYPQGLLLSAEGHVVETLHHNIFWIKDNNIYTPMLDRCGVSGVMRGVLIQAVLPKLRMPFTEVRQTLPELLAADEVFICNSVHGIVPVTAIDDCSFSVEGKAKRLGTKAKRAVSKTKAVVEALNVELPEVYGESH